jgi:hypothetical protein
VHRRYGYLQHFNHPIVTLARCHQEELVRQADQQRLLDQAGTTQSEATPARVALRRWLGARLPGRWRIRQSLERAG